MKVEWIHGRAGLAVFPAKLAFGLLDYYSLGPITSSQKPAYQPQKTKDVRNLTSLEKAAFCRMPALRFHVFNS
jgi:hypothetical protein